MTFPDWPLGPCLEPCLVQYRKSPKNWFMPFLISCICCLKCFTFYFFQKKKRGINVYSACEHCVNFSPMACHQRWYLMNGYYWKKTQRQAWLTIWDIAKEACCQMSIISFSSASKFNSIFSSEWSILPFSEVFGLGLDVVTSGETDDRDTRGILWKQTDKTGNIKILFNRSLFSWPCYFVNFVVSL